MAETPAENPQTPIDAAEAARRAGQRRRAMALGIALGLFAVIFYVLTIVKLGPAVFLSRDL